MTAPRSTKEEKQYRTYRKNEGDAECPFCSIQKGHPQFVRQTAHLKIIRNRTPYSLWDGQAVTDHLMIVPKEHVNSLANLDDTAAIEFTRLLGEYEPHGYNIYARSVDSKNRSVVHQHTHLLKLDGKQKRFLLMIKLRHYLRMSW